MNFIELAPTACNFQPQRILVIESPAAIKMLRECTPTHFNAPTALLVCYDDISSCKNSYKIVYTPCGLARKTI